ncbi:MAG: site-2 protease family protein [Planctomycetes bacterium]|nr:site-2 protease family protein [Planctomycetota bacterium]
MAEEEQEGSGAFEEGSPLEEDGTEAPPDAAAPEPPLPPEEPSQAEAPPPPAPLPRVTPLAVAFFAVSIFAPIPLLGGAPIALAGLIGAAWWLRRRPGPPDLDHDRYLIRAGLVPLGIGVALFALVAAVVFTHAPALGTGESFGEDAEKRTLPVRLSMFGVLFLSIIAHECAHGIAALWSGDPTARDMRRITLNPIRHIDPVGSILVPILSWGAGFVIGWARPVPLMLARLRHRRWGPFAVAAAGPFANIAIALASLGLLAATGYTLRLAGIGAEGLFHPWRPVAISGTPAEPVLQFWIEALKFGFVLSGVLAGFNLVPLPPLDGSWILESILPAPVAGIFRKLRRFGFLLVILALVTGAIDYLLYPALIVLVALLVGVESLFYAL